ncbi:ATP-dependent nuclease [Bacillus salipaludis]|uniref:AAA family ATPase n=1 Tax=Bacillus salipaludis TaxID=2547811 RepID=A0AA90TUR7_9BACI|nr:AAA family ATPase [Bacillus salipaludis]MDQ6600689.1 AAA family ATPase [Bacillus salipaludis]
MKLVKLEITNFRSFGPETVVVNFENLTTFLGLNSSGKSTVMNAIRKMFSPIEAETALEENDFHLDALKNRSDKLEITAFFVVEDGEENHDKFPFGRLNLKTNDEGKLFFTVELVGDFIKDTKEVVKSLYVNGTDTYPYNNKPIQAIYIPTFRNPLEQLRITKDSILNRMFQFLQDEGKEGKIILEPALENLKQIISEGWKEFVFDKRYENINLDFINEELIVTFQLDGKNQYSLDQIGDGLKAVFYIVLITALLNLEWKSMDYFESPERLTKVEGFEPYKQSEMYPILSIILLEEPESHVAPYFMGRIIENLRALSGRSNGQVIITSHSASVVGRITPKEIRHVSIDYQNYKSIVKKVLLPDEQQDAYKFIAATLQTYPEIFFSRFVVLGEGASEKIILTRLIEELNNTSLDSSAVSFVPLGGRYVNHLWSLLQDINIPFITLLDLDRERGNDCGWGRIKHILEQLISLQENRKQKYNADELLTINEAKYRIEDINEMDKWKMESIEDAKDLEKWANHLEKYDVFFSSPLDLDFLMLSTFENAYMQLIPPGGGPTSDVTSALKATLKSEDKGVTFTEVEKEKMIYYKYFFLGKRGKPTTHLMALQTVSEEDFVKFLPDVLKRLNEKILQKINNDPYVRT